MWNFFKMLSSVEVVVRSERKRGRKKRKKGRKEEICDAKTFLFPHLQS